MQFDSLTAVWAMGGHGAYVWSAYVISIVTLVAIIAIPVQRSRRIVDEIRSGEQRRAARARSADSAQASSH
ncbi:MAG: heme exporter protein CcmD [Spongiibacteraceae bacterium]